MIRTKVSPEQWKPIPPLQPRFGSSVSILFVNSQGVLYHEPSIDPIFPATKPYDFGNSVGVRYLRSSRRDSILGCADSVRWQIPSVSDVWYEYNGRDRNGKYFNPDSLQNLSRQSRGGIRLIFRSLASSRIGMNIQCRAGIGLVASKLLENKYSYQLAKDQWKKEAQHLFETSRMRILINARDIAQGAGAKYGAHRIEEGSAELCDKTFLFKSQGWRNVHVAGSAWIIVYCVLVLLAAVPLDDERLLAEPVWHAFIGAAAHAVREGARLYNMVNRWAWNVRLMIM